MKWLNWLERRFPNFTIPQFPLFIASATGLIYLMSQMQPAFLGKLYLEPLAVLSGEWWRVITFLFVPPEMNPIFLVFWLIFLYQMALTLESAWGELRFFVFYFIGAAATVLSSLFLVHATLGNGWLNTSLFLAYGTLVPNAEFFIFPIPFRIKIKYAAIVVWIVVALYLGFGDYKTRIEIAASLANYLLFFGEDLWRRFKP